MSEVVRLETVAELDDGAARAGDDAGGAGALSVRVRHDAVLADGRRLPLLDDRGWSQSPGGAGAAVTPSAADVETTARTVVGPDEPFGDRSREQLAADHWQHLADVLRRHGVLVDPPALARLPHTVVLGERLRALVGR